MANWRTWAKEMLLRRDMIISRPPGQYNIMDVKLKKLRARGLDVRVAVDGGAAGGGWARELKSVFPDAQVLCIEPREDAQAELAQTARELKGITIAKTLIGAEAGTVEFFEHSDQSSMLPGATRGAFGNVIREQVRTLDELVQTLGLPAPDYVKLDLQGAEMMAMAGATESLAKAQAVQLEVSFIPFQKGNPLIGDIVPFMRERGFRVHDIFGLWHRPLDGALAQGDFLFLRDDHPLLADVRWDQQSEWT